MRTCYLVIVCFLIYTGCTATSAQELKVACVGNSITFGAGIADQVNDSYPAQLQKLLGESYTVLNAGNSGRTMLKKGDYPLWVEPEFKAAIEMVPDVVVILLGTNDSKPQNWEFKDEYVPDYISMIDTFRTVNSDVDIYACLPPPAFSVQWGIRDSIITTDIIPMIRKIADSTNVDTIDFYQPFIDRNVLFPDDIHPSAEGAWEMARIVYHAMTGKSVTEIQDVDVAKGKPVTAISFDMCTSPEALVDGDPRSKWSCKSSGAAVVDLDAVESIDLFQTDFGEEGAAFGQYYTIEVSTDSIEWQMAVDKSEGGDASVRIAVDRTMPMDARFVKLTPIGPVTGVRESVGAYEFRVMRSAPLHAPALYIDDIEPGSRFTRYKYYVLPTFDSGYLKVVRSNDTGEPFLDIKGYRISEPQSSTGSARPDRVQRYFTKAYFDGLEVLSADTLTVDWSISAVDIQRESFLPQQLDLAQNYPNPFNASTLISYQLPNSVAVELAIYNALGKRVRTLVNAFQPAGRYSVIWGGKDDSGECVSSGLYYYRLLADKKVVQTKKSLLLR
ncbi:T9SS C-terminal target domain-containing protein [candidate division KSB1 bacterium]|nr:discoidin domain-containing protein [candidate division KSB1 bacterium]RQW04816.1 MAG: T9SS C-terminal target domain-containing protein [candidate division KSB1 bacterium]